MADSGAKSDASPVVFVVDDDPTVRKALARLLESWGVRADTFASGTAFLEVARAAFGSRSMGNGPPACVILDVSMPEMSGLTLQGLFVEEGILIPIVFITGHGRISDSVRAMKGGAVDYLQKPVDEAALKLAVDRAFVIHGEALHRVAAAEIVGRRMARLTPREAQVMESVVRGLPNRATAEELGISERTVKVHRGRVMKKMEAASIPDLVRMAQGSARFGDAASRELGR